MKILNQFPMLLGVKKLTVGILLIYQMLTNQFPCLKYHSQVKIHKSLIKYKAILGLTISMVLET
jgi:hypothetical protein